MGSETMSKTRLLQSIKSLKRDDVAVLLEAHPELKHVRDERGRNALHSLCSLPGADKTRETLEERIDPRILPVVSRVQR